MNGRDFDRIHDDLSLANNHTKEFHTRSVGDTFGQFEGKLVFIKTKEDMTSFFMMKYEISICVNA